MEAIKKQGLELPVNLLLELGVGLPLLPIGVPMQPPRVEDRALDVRELVGQVLLPWCGFALLDGAGQEDSAAADLLDGRWSYIDECLSNLPGCVIMICIL